MCYVLPLCAMSCQVFNALSQTLGVVAGRPYQLCYARIYAY